MAKHTDLPIYKVCYDLVVLSMAFTRQMPRDVKLTLGRDLYQECMAMVTLIARANAARDKTPHLQLLAERLDTARILVRVGHDTRVISHKAYAQAIASEMGRTLLGAWSGETFSLSAAPVWVRPVAVGLSVAQGEVRP